MRGADKVHVRTLEEQHIQAVQFSRRGSSQLRVNIMTTGATQLHRHTVHKHLVFADLHLTETHPFAETADFLSVAHDLHVQGIKIRMLGIPLQRSRDLQILAVHARLQGKARLWQLHLPAIGSQQGINNLFASHPVHLITHPQHGILILCIQIRLEVEIGRMILRQGKEGDIPQDAADGMMRIARSIRDLIEAIGHFQADLVLPASLHEVGHIGFPPRKAAKVLAHELPVDKQPGMAIDTVEAQDDRLSLEVGRHGERLSVKERLVVADGITLHRRFAGH